MTNSTLIDVAALPFNSLTNLIQALGGLIALSLIFGVVNLLMNRKRHKELKDIRRDIAELKRMLEKKSKKK